LVGDCRSFVGETDDAFDNERGLRIDFKLVDETDNWLCKTGDDTVTGEWMPVVAVVLDSGDGNNADSLVTFNVGVGVAVVMTANGGGSCLRLNLADGPRRSRIFTDDVLGACLAESNANEFVWSVDIDGFTDDGTDNVDRGTVEPDVSMRLIVDGVLDIVANGIELMLSDDDMSDGDMSEAGTGGGGGWSAAGNELKQMLTSRSFRRRHPAKTNNAILQWRIVSGSDSSSCDLCLRNGSMNVCQ
jgi:hypothetical protein